MEEGLAVGCKVVDGAGVGAEVVGGILIVGLVVGAAVGPVLTPQHVTGQFSRISAAVVG